MTRSAASTRCAASSCSRSTIDPLSAKTEKRPSGEHPSHCAGSLARLRRAPADTSHSRTTRSLPVAKTRPSTAAGSSRRGGVPGVGEDGELRAGGDVDDEQVVTRPGDKDAAPVVDRSLAAPAIVVSGSAEFHRGDAVEPSGDEPTTVWRQGGAEHPSLVRSDGAILRAGRNIPDADGLVPPAVTARLGSPRTNAAALTWPRACPAERLHDARESTCPRRQCPSPPRQEPRAVRRDGDDAPREWATSGRCYQNGRR